SVSEAPIPGRFVASKGIALTVQLKYRDYVVRMVTSWRTKGIALGILALVIGTFLYSTAHPPPDAVNSPTKVFLIILPIMTTMLLVMLSLISLISWFSEKKNI